METISYLYSLRGNNFVLHYEIKEGTVGIMKGIFYCNKSLSGIEEKINKFGELLIPFKTKKEFEEDCLGNFVPF